MKILKAIGKFFVSFLLVLLVLGLLWFIIYLAVPSPQKTVRSFFNLIKMEKYNEAYKLIDGPYKAKRGSLEKFTLEYSMAVQTGTRTEKINISGIKSTKNPLQKIVSVTVSVFYTGSMVDTQGSYLVEKIPGKGWRIVDNVSSQENKLNPKKANSPLLPKSNP